MLCVMNYTMFAVLASLIVLLRPVLTQAPGNLRLRDGPHINEGRLEIFLNGEWGTICDNGWSQQDADVACRQLGFLGAEKSVRGSHYGVGDGEIWLDEMRCRGDELSLLACDNDMISGHDCSHDKDAGVVCLMPDMIRLADGKAPNAGRLEIYHDNEWGLVCRDEFNDTDGRVVCQQLGYAKLKEYYWGMRNQTSQSPDKIWLDDVNCSTSHVKLSQCKSRGWGVTDCEHGDHISVACEGVPTVPNRPVVTMTTCNNAILQWRQTSSNSEYNIHYNIRYRQVDDRSADWNYIIHDGSPDHLRLLRATIRDLTPATSYEVAIGANNAIGNSSYSESVTMATQEIVFDPPVNVSVADGGSGTLHVNWIYSANEECGVSADIHMVEYSASGNTHHLIVHNTSCTITGLTVNVLYNISVRVGIATPHGYILSHPSESITGVSMPTTAPVIAPGQLSTWTINSSTILLSWQCTDEAKSGYSIQCHKHDDQSNTWSRNVTACTHLEQGIRNNIVYTCKVASFNEVGLGPFSHTTNTVPEYDAWNAVPNTSLLEVTMNSITLAIDQGSHDAPDGYVVTETIGYNVTCRSSSVLSHVTVLGSVVNITVDKLSPHQQYTCDIVAINKFGAGNVTQVTVTTLASAPTGPPRGLFISDQLYLQWLPPATDQQHSSITDYNVSCVMVEEGRDPYDATLHDTSNAWNVKASQLGYHHDNSDKSINISMPMFTPSKLLSCRVAAINENGQGPYQYHVTTVIPPGVNIKIQDLQAVVASNSTILFQWQPLTNDNISKLAVTGYLLQCNSGHDNHMWEHTVWGPSLSTATISTQQFLTTVQYTCTIRAFNAKGFGLYSDSVKLHTHGTSSSKEKWYREEPVIYALLSLIGVTMVIIILLLLCLCYCACHRRDKLYSGTNEIADTMPTKTMDNTYLQSTEYESLDNLYDKTLPPNNKIDPLSNKSDSSIDNEQLPAEEEYMKMAPSRSCSHATIKSIKSDTLRSCDVKLNQMDFDCQDNQQTSNPHYNSLPNYHTHYDVPTNNSTSCHSNIVSDNHYDTPRKIN